MLSVGRLLHSRTTPVLAAVAVAGAILLPTAAHAQSYDYRVLATSKTSTLEKEMNEAADAGFRFSFVMGGETAIGGSEGVAVMTRSGDAGKYAYKLLATSKTSTMQKELQEASDAGFEYRGADGVQVHVRGAGSRLHPGAGRAAGVEAVRLQAAGHEQDLDTRERAPRGGRRRV